MSRGRAEGSLTALVSMNCASMQYDQDRPYSFQYRVFYFPYFVVSCYHYCLVCERQAFRRLDNTYTYKEEL